MRKRCTLCGKIKPTTKFGVDNKSHDNLRTRCRICTRIQDKNRQHTLSRRFSNYKARAKKDNRIFNINIDKFKNITNKQCEYCGGYSDSDIDEQFCGIDRIDSSMGYVVDNIVPCCYICNMMKASLTYDEFTNHVKKIAHRLKQHKG